MYWEITSTPHAREDTIVIRTLITAAAVLLATSSVAHAQFSEEVWRQGGFLPGAGLMYGNAQGFQYTPPPAFDRDSQRSAYQNPVAPYRDVPRFDPSRPYTSPWHGCNENKKCDYQQGGSGFNYNGRSRGY
jgi:hypothetical protein